MTDDVRDGSPEPTPEEPPEGQAPETEAAPSPEGEEAPAPEAEVETAPGPEAGEVPVPAEGEPAPGGPALPAAMGVVEALLYASGKAATVEHLAEAAELEPAEVEEALAAIEAACQADGRGIRLDRVAGGVRLVSRPEFDYPVRRLLGLEGKTKLSMAALETLAIVAYRQPVTAPEVMELRGVNSASSVRTLLDRKLITTAGRKEVVGTPFLYKTTKEFLVHFGLNDLSALPKPEELEAIYGLEPAGPPEPAQVELFPTDESEGIPESGAEAPPEEPRPEETN
jgi:segregation and condensation protein B